MFRIITGSYEMVCDLVVAELEYDVLLGYAILMGSENGPADLLLSKGLIRLDGTDIPCVQIGRRNRSRRATGADDSYIVGRPEWWMSMSREKKTMNGTMLAKYDIDASRH